MMPAPPELKATLNLPHSDFPMKANLPQSEPRRLAAWEQDGIYEQIRALRRDAPPYVLHDGPPYANGELHLGHALNKCLKDFVVKSKTMAGFNAPYVPGWDCHGLPIEIKVDEKLGRKKLEMPAIAVRRACREYAQKYLDLQREQFKRLGVFGRWGDPYSTMTPEYESKIMETLFQFLENGFVYKGLKPVLWCMHDRTALAEAEIEYEMHTSPSVYVRYRLTSPAEAIDARLAGKRVSTIIWTTTPWTLPASLAVAFHPDFEYVALEQDGDVYIVAEALAASTRVACGLERAHEIARFPGARMDRVTFAHPFLERSILGVLATYVTTDQGTGAVHTAPAHGVDDFATGARYGLSQLCDVDDGGHLRNGLPEYDGLYVFKANPRIIELLVARHALMGQQEIHHSYPHCWRCHRPVIYRATEQWFIKMETPMTEPDGSVTTFRKRALEEIARVKWDPAWGRERIANMVSTRPDWCISRQRIWGVPIAVFLCTACGKPLNDPEVNRRVVDLFAKEGADAWYIKDVAEILPPGTVCGSCGKSGEFKKETDIVDVWFESGCSQAAVLGREADLPWPADLYLEGGDQHRGWFQSSLLCAVGTRNAAPYRMAATAGWTLDEQGRAMSKSLGNGVDPVDIAERLGAEIVRLWVASVDFREDVVASENLMQRVAETYRKLRNTFRFLLSNLNGFEPEQHAVPWEQMPPLDRYMLTRTRELTEKILGWYEDFEFHRIYHALNEFAVAELSALYIDAVKDRIYTFAPQNPARRSAQTVLWKIAEALVRLVAPLLSFTADEVWQYMPAISNRLPSVHLELFPTPESLAATIDTGLMSDWATLLMIRDEALKSLEEARKAKQIGKALDARLVLEVPADTAALLERYRGNLKELLNVSQVELRTGPSSQITATTLTADGKKCERCWNYSVHVGEDRRWPTVCERCSAALDQMGFPPDQEA
ncbi:MAG TPA: isoleucine--tRNA ligase [Acidobacteriaceae bacterium]|nr:isoleucine--tRNA ligase [Acidobacteriaceae bacterium]